MAEGVTQHPIAECDRLLRALPGYDQFRCTPKAFDCSCGRRWVHVCDESEGCWYEIDDEPAA